MKFHRIPFTVFTSAVIAASLIAASLPVSVAQAAGNSKKVFLPVISSSVSQSQLPSGGSGPVGVSGSWKLKWSDEFNGSSLDTSKWEPNWLGGSTTAITKPINGNEQSCYDPAQVSESGGSLKLTAVARSCRASNGSTYSYASGK